MLASVLASIFNSFIIILVSVQVFQENIHCAGLRNVYIYA